MRIITGTITNGVTLASGDSPVLVGGIVTNDSTTSSTAAVYAGTGVYVDIRNTGRIGDTTQTAFGIRLVAGGTITNGAPISTDAVIEGSSYGVRPGGATTVTNYGSIFGSAAARFLTTGKITNGSTADTTALISGSSSEGVSFGFDGGAGGTVANFGTIESAQFFGVQMITGGRVTNGSSADAQALITGNGDGIQFQLGSGTVGNFGTIIATNPIGIGILSDFDAASLNVTNGSGTSISALITGNSGVFGQTANNKIVNFATITGTGFSGQAVYLGGGTIANGSTTSTAALLQGHFVGVYLKGAGRVTNFGKIEGGSVGILVAAGGTIVNGGSSDTTALIGNGIDGIDVSGATATTITNFGTIKGVVSSILFGTGDDKLIVEPGAKFIGAVDGGAGTDTATFAGGGTLAIGNFSGFEHFALSSASADTLRLTNANFADVTGSTITVTAGSPGDTVNASAVTGGNDVVLVGGAGNDVFEFSAASLAPTDTVVGGGGTDTLQMTAVGTIQAGGVSGVETYALANGGANKLTLTNVNFTGVTGSTITIRAGSGGNTINAGALTGSNAIVLVGGADADRLTAAQHATMTGGAGADIFVLTTPGTLAAPDTNTITDFTHGTDKITFSDTGFSLKLSGASATPKALPSTLFVSNSTGRFTSTAQRFAYNTTTGALDYDAKGNTAGSAKELIATLTGHPTLTASDLSFVS